MHESGNPVPPFQPPIPSPTGDPNYGSNIPQAGPAQINFDVIPRAWEILKPTLGTWVVAFLIYVAIVGVIAVVSGKITGTMPSGGGAQAMPNMPLMLAGNLIQFVVSQFLAGGLYRMAINQVRGQAPSLGTMFSVGDVLPALLGAALLTGIATGVGAMCCVLPGLLLAGLFMFTIPLVVDRKLGAIDAITTSLNTLKPQMWMALVFVIVMAIVACAGMLLCGVGVLITGPLAILSMAILYRDFYPQPALS